MYVYAEDFLPEEEKQHRLSRQKIALAQLLTDFGYTVILSNVDSVWLKDPTPYISRWHHLLCQLPFFQVQTSTICVLVRSTEIQLLCPQGSNTNLKSCFECSVLLQICKVDFLLPGNLSGQQSLLTSRKTRHLLGTLVHLSFIEHFFWLHLTMTLALCKLLTNNVGICRFEGVDILVASDELQTSLDPKDEDLELLEAINGDLSLGERIVTDQLILANIDCSSFECLCLFA